MREVARIFNINRKTVASHLKKSNIDTKHKPKYDINEIIELFEKYQNFSKVGKIIGSSGVYVRKKLEPLGYKSPDRKSTRLNSSHA